MGQRVGVLLSGCGALDGTEIHGAVLALLYLDRAGAEVICAAPDVDQVHVLDQPVCEIGQGFISQFIRK